MPSLWAVVGLEKRAQGMPAIRQADAVIAWCGCPVCAHTDTAAQSEWNCLGIRLGRGLEQRWTPNGPGGWDPLESTCRHASLSIL